MVPFEGVILSTLSVQAWKSSQKIQDHTFRETVKI